MFKINDTVKIKQFAWARFLESAHDPVFLPSSVDQETINEIEELDDRTVYYLKSFPNYWYEEELELVRKALEPVHQLEINGQIVKVGDILNCTCRYRISELLPEYDKTGNHIKDHPHNDFNYNTIDYNNCVVHHWKIE